MGTENLKHKEKLAFYDYFVYVHLAMDHRDITKTQRYSSRFLLQRLVWQFLAQSRVIHIIGPNTHVS